jgi:hypothetical protein
MSDQPDNGKCVRCGEPKSGPWDLCCGCSHTTAHAPILPPLTDDEVQVEIVRAVVAEGYPCEVDRGDFKAIASILRQLDATRAKLARERERGDRMRAAITRVLDDLDGSGHVRIAIEEALARDPQAGQEGGGE